MEKGQLIEQLKKESERRGIPFPIAYGLMGVESGWKSGVSDKYEPHIDDASHGPMQILYGTARGMGFTGSREELRKPEVNVPLGLDYLQKQYRRYGNWGDAVAAYNAGSVLRDDQGGYKNADYVRNVMGYALEQDPSIMESAGIPADLRPVASTRSSYSRSSGWDGLFPPAIQNLYNPPMNDAEIQNMMGTAFRPVLDRFAAQQELLGPEFNQATSQLQATMNAPLSQFGPTSGPMLNVPPTMTPMQAGLGGLFSNLATAVSENPFYQNEFAGRRAQMEQNNLEAQQKNTLMERQELLQRRAESLNFQLQTWDSIRERLLEAGKGYEATLAEQKKLELMTKLDQLKEQNETFRVLAEQHIATSGQIERSMMSNLRRLGYRQNENGEWEATPDLAKLLPVKDAEAIISENIKIMDGKDTPKEARALAAAQVIAGLSRYREGDDALAPLRRLNAQAAQIAVAIGANPKDEKFIRAIGQEFQRNLVQERNFGLAYGQQRIPGIEEAYEAISKGQTPAPAPAPTEPATTKEPKAKQPAGEAKGGAKAEEEFARQASEGTAQFKEENRKKALLKFVESAPPDEPDISGLSYEDQLSKELEYLDKRVAWMTTGVHAGVLPQEDLEKVRDRLRKLRSEEQSYKSRKRALLSRPGGTRSAD